MCVTKFEVVNTFCFPATSITTDFKEVKKLNNLAPFHFQKIVYISLRTYGKDDKRRAEESKRSQCCVDLNRILRNVVQIYLYDTNDTNTIQNKRPASRSTYTHLYHGRAVFILLVVCGKR